MDSVATTGQWEGQANGASLSTRVTRTVPGLGTMDSATAPWGPLQQFGYHGFCYCAMGPTATVRCTGESHGWLVHTTYLALYATWTRP
jgi:hypothetical protein